MHSTLTLNVTAITICDKIIKANSPRNVDRNVVLLSQLEVSIYQCSPVSLTSDTLFFHLFIGQVQSYYHYRLNNKWTKISKSVSAIVYKGKNTACFSQQPKHVFYTHFTHWLKNNNQSKLASEIKINMYICTIHLYTGIAYGRGLIGEFYVQRLQN